jgi:rod shape-determining protein MreD
MINTFLRWTGLLIFLFILQTTIVPVIAIFGVKPDLLLLALFFLAIRTDVIPAVFTGFILGLAQDFYSPEILGQNALSKSIAGYFAGLFNEKVMRLDPFFQLVLLFLMFVLHDAVYFTVQVLQTDAPLQLIGTQIVTSTLPRAVYSLFFGLFPTFREYLFTSDNRR